MRARIGTIQAAFPDDACHALAVKANPLVEVLREAVAQGAGLEAAGMEEVHLALAAGCEPHRIILNSPAKTPEDLEEAIRLGVYINADNFEELRRIDEIARRGFEPFGVAIRINPMVGTGKIASTSAAGRDSKFGIFLSGAFDELLRAFREYPWLDGLHVHTGSQGCGVSLLTEAAGRMVALRDKIHHALGEHRIRLIDIGGGLPVAYQSSDTPPTVWDYVDNIRASAPGLFAPGLQVVTEFGRYVQAGCGFAASRVEYVKGSHPRFAVVHVGADLFLRRAYRAEEWPLEIHLLDSRGRPKTGKAEPYTVAGPLCFPGDILARDLYMPPVEPGDWMIFRDIGAYTLSMWSRHCNRGIPRVVGYDREAGFRTLRREETPRDLVRFWSCD